MPRIPFGPVPRYLLAAAVVQPLLSNLPDVFGRREILLLSLILFVIGTVLCSTAQDFTVLLAGHSVQGIGGGGGWALSNVILTDIIPLRQRPAYQSLFQIAWAVGLITGPLVGGLFAQYSTWRWCFYLSIPVLPSCNNHGADIFKPRN